MVVLVDIGVPGGGVRGGVLVDLAVAVVVRGVTDLDSVRADGSISIVAVVGVVHVAARLGTGRHCHRGVPMAVRVGVCVEGQRVHRVAFIGLAVAVVVDGVAQLVGAGVHRGVRVVAIVHRALKGVAVDIRVADVAVSVAVQVRLVVVGNLGAVVGVIGDTVGVRVEHFGARVVADILRAVDTAR